MKLLKTVVPILILLLSAGFGASAQTVTGKWSGQDVKTVLKEIEAQTGLSIFYRTDEVDDTATVSAEFNRVPVDEALGSIFGDGIEVSISGKMIILSRKDTGSKNIVSGKVFDQDGLPVPGAGVFIKGTTTGVSTDLDGGYSISAKDGDVLLVASLGFKDTEVKVGRSKLINITIEEENEMLEEVVFVGYGVQKKENLTGAVSVVTSKSIQDRSVSNLGNILQGAVPGMTVTSASGRPGEGVSLNIRGWNSINTGSPLVLVDGVVGSLDRVNPNDVESISVLKDASSAAVYGAQAAFGVVLITTKSGSDKEGKAQVHYSGRWGFSSPTTSTDWESRGYYSVYVPNLFMKAFNGKQQITYDETDMQMLWDRRNDVVENPQRPWVIIDQSKGTPTYKYYANTDWWRVFFNDRKPMQNHDLSIRGGSKGVKYFLSGNYNREQGIFRVNPDVYDKYNLRSRVSFDVNKWINVSNNTTFFASTYTYPGLADMTDTFYKLTAGYFSFIEPINPDGTYVYQVNAGGGGQSIWGNIANKNFVNSNKNNNFTNTFELTLKPVRQVEVKGNYTYSYNNYAALNRSVNGVFSATTPMKTVTLTTDDNEDKLSEQVQTVNLHSANIYATYTDTFADAHNLKVTAGGQWETYYHKKLYATGYGLLSEELNDQKLVSADEAGNKRTTTDGGQTQYALLGFFGRVNYDYKGKYLLELSGRYDGTSRFPKGQRYGFFPSGSVGWRISEEPFFSPIKGWWNDLKLRFSYGSLGNQQVGYYDYIRSVTLSTQNYLFGGDKSSTATFGNPVAGNLTWETVQQKNIGLDMAFLGNKITFSGEAYVRDTKNMLTTGKALPAVYGASAPKTNNADLRTMGYELMLTYRNAFDLAGSPFNYSITATFNDFIGFITKFDNPTKSLSTYYEGMRYGEIWGYTTDGFFASDEEAASYPVDQSPVCTIIYGSTGGELGLRAGDLKYVDLDRDGVIGPGANTVDKPGDRKIIGNSQPRYQYGATISFGWLGFDFSMFLQGIGRINWYPSVDSRYFWGPYARPFSSWIQKDFLDDCWSEDNPNAYFPRPRAYVAGVGDNRELTTVNDRYLQNLGYLRLKNLTFGYTLPQKLTSKLAIESVRFYFTGENLAYAAPGFHCDYMDPEAAARTSKKDHIYPWQKTFMFGIDVNF